MGPEGCGQAKGKDGPATSGTMAKRTGTIKVDEVRGPGRTTAEKEDREVAAGRGAGRQGAPGRRGLREKE